MAQALAEAKRSILAPDSAWQHPYQRAPFIATGDASAPVADPGPPLLRRLLIPAAAVLLVGAVLLVACRRRR